MKRIIMVVGCLLLASVLIFAATLQLTACERWKAKDSEMDNESYYKLGMEYFADEGKNQDITKALKYIQKAAERGHAAAQYKLGSLYDKGFAVEHNLEKAYEWYRKSAEQGYAEAQYKLGVCYQRGNGVVRDYKEAVKWFRLAA